MTGVWGGRERPVRSAKPLVGLLMLSAGACGGVMPAPVAIPTPEVALRPVLMPPAPASDVLVPPRLDGLADEILTTPMLRNADFNAAVDQWVHYWQGASWFEGYLGRMSMYVDRVDSLLADRGLPPSLRYLPMIESGYNPNAVSRARAVGMWQFMQGTAEGVGLEVGPLLDQRRDPVRSTAVALDFLAQLRDDFGSWFLALAAYNSGPNRVRRVLDRYAPMAPGSDSLFWAIRDHLPKETQDFLPKLFGAITVASRPVAFGFEEPPPEPISFDEVTVPDATTLDVVARVAGVSEDAVVRLNPQFVRGITPPREEVVVRIPSGRADVFRANYAALPVEERVTFVEHKVASGETLSHIAVRYGLSVADLEAANPGVRPRYLRVGAVLTVPVAPSARSRRP